MNEKSELFTDDGEELNLQPLGFPEGLTLFADEVQSAAMLPDHWYEGEFCITLKLVNGGRIVGVPIFLPEAQAMCSRINLWIRESRGEEESE